MPVALDCFEAPEPFTFRGRKTGNERRPLTPIVDEMRCKPDREASSKTDEKPCPEHNGTPVQNARIMVHCGGGDIAAHFWAICSCDFVSSGTSCIGPLAHRGEALFHEPKGPAPFHSIKSVDNLVSIENGYQPVHRARSVARAECNVFPKDAHGPQYDVLIRAY